MNNIEREKMKEYWKKDLMRMMENRAEISKEDFDELCLRYGRHGFVWSKPVKHEYYYVDKYFLEKSKLKEKLTEELKEKQIDIDVRKI
jgi:hypothetical protein